MDGNTGIKVYSAAIICTAITGCSYLGAKISMMYGSVLDALFFRFMIAFIFALLLIAFKAVKIDLKNKKTAPLLVPAVLYAVGFFGFQFLGLQYASSVEAGIIMAAQPALTLILAELLIKEKTGVIQRICVLSAIVAAAFISVYGKGGIESVSIKGCVLILLSALSMSANIVAIRRLRNEYTPVEISFVSCGLGFTVYTIAVLISGGLTGTLANTFSLIKEPGFMAAVLYLGIGCTMVSTLLNSYTTRYLEAVKVSIFGCAGTVITLTTGALILREELSVMQVICSVIILAAVFGTNYSGRKNTKRKEGKL